MGPVRAEATRPQRDRSPVAALAPWLKDRRWVADGTTMNIDKLMARCAALLPDGERPIAATKAIPRGSMHEVILGGAGAVAGAGVHAAAAGAGAVMGSRAGESVGDSGRAERADAGVDVGRASQVLMVVTDRSVALFSLSAMGRPKALEATLPRERIATVCEGEAKLFGQKMLEIVIETTDGAEVGFGVAKVHRGHGRSVLDALS